MLSPNQQYFERQPEPNQSCLLALRAIILNFDDRITETTKYGMPCFCIGKKPVFYLWTDKKTNNPYVLVVRGNEIEHAALEQGARAKMKVLNVNPNEDLPEADLSEVMELVVGLYLEK